MASTHEMEALAASAARQSLLAYAIGMIPRYETPAHLELLAEKLEAVERGEIKRLMVFMPPRHGKSNLTSEVFPAWYLGRNPDRQVMFTTYAQDLADGFGRKVRNAVADPRHVRSFPDSVLSEDSQSAKRFNTTAGGVYYAVGAGGPVTGRGADCMVEGTLVQTAAGAVHVENLKVGAASGKILSLNQREMRLEYRELQAIASREADGLYRITTESGRVLEVTGNHRVFVGGEYREASSISPGDVVVCLLQEGLCKAGVSVPQEPESRACGQLLQQGVLGVAPRGQEHEALREVRESGEAEWRMQGRAILQGVQAAKSWAKNNIRAKAAELPDMRGWISGEVARWRAVCNLLRQALRGDRSLKADVGGQQPKVEGWRNPTAQAASFCESIQGDAPAHSGAGWESVCGVRGVGHQAGGASHRQLAHEQFRVEPSDAMRPLPQQVARGEGWQAQCDVVAVVERVRAKARVYDIQVEENQNLFANGVCVHNCLIIDDPLKNREEADSKLIRDKLWDWYASTAYTRLMPGGAVVLVQTRWHEDDLAGRLLNGPEQWEVVNLPALAEDGDELGREPGEALWPERYDEHALERIRSTIGEREFIALYQQRPAPLDGAMFRRDWIKRGKAPRAGVHVAMGVDLALSTKTSADYTAIVVMSRDEFGKLYVLDAVRERVDFPGALRLIRQMAEKWNPRQIAIEQVAYQAVVVQELLRQTTLPIKGVTPDKDKVTRAQPLALRYEQGLVSHEQLPSWFEDELLAFPQGAHDDSVDALVYAYQAVMRMTRYDDGISTAVARYEALDPEMGY